MEFVDGYVNVIEFIDGKPQEIEEFDKGRIYRLKVKKDNLDELPKDNKGYVHFEAVTKKDKTGMYLRENEYMNKRIKQQENEPDVSEDLPF